LLKLQYPASNCAYINTFIPSTMPAYGSECQWEEFFLQSELNNSTFFLTTHPHNLSFYWH